MTQSALAQELNQLIIAGLEQREANIRSLPASLIEYDAPSGRWRRQLLLTPDGGSKVGDIVPLADNELLVFRETEDVAKVMPQLVKPPKPVTAVTVRVRLQDPQVTGPGLVLSTQTARAENGIEAVRDAILGAKAEIEDALFKGFGLVLEVAVRET
jgi:hypothetical protein